MMGVRAYVVLLITTAHRQCLTSLAVSDKHIPEWLTISGSLQDWGLVCWEAACLVWRPESCVTAAQCSCARVVYWKVSRQQLDRRMAATVWAARHHSSPMHHSLSPTHGCTKTTPVCQSLETPTETDTQEHVYQKPVRDVNELKQHVIETRWALSNQQSFVDQATDQWRGCFSTCLKTKSSHFDVFLRNFMT